MKFTDLFRFSIPVFGLLWPVFILAQSPQPQLPKNHNLQAEQHWVDSVYATLKPQERIAQLMVVRTYSNKDKKYYNRISKLIKNYNIGGLTFFQGGPVRQAILTNRWQAESKTPLLISIDAEWGLGMRLDSCYSFPRQMTLGAMQSDSLVYQMGDQIARHLHRMGIQMNFAPVVDVNNNPNNPVINSRSFGEDKWNVARKGLAYMQGLQDHNIITTAKHFPGHGDTDSDSHYTLPIIKHSIPRLDSVELTPFKHLINNGLQGIMAAHLYIPAWEQRANRATSLSQKVISQLLTDTLGFQGLKITDGIDMQGITKYFKSGEAELEALKAGHDLILLPTDVPKALKRIQKAIKNNEISAAEIETKCRKVLAWKYRTGLNQLQEIPLKSLYNDLNTPDNQAISLAVFEAANTLVKNEDKLLPLRRPDTLRIACLAIGSKAPNSFQKTLGQYFSCTPFQLPTQFSPEQAAATRAQLAAFDLVFVSVHGTNQSPSKHFGITKSTRTLIQSLSSEHPLVLSLFANPYALADFSKMSDIKSIFVAYQDQVISQQVAAQQLAGARPISGQLPVTACPEYPLHTGIHTTSLKKLRISVPEAIGLKSKAFNPIDSIVQAGIQAKAFPGCQVLVAVKGAIIYNKSFGYHTYQKKQKTRDTDLYDVASVTKLAATTLAVMKLQETGRMDIDHRVAEYLPYLSYSNKKSLIIRDVMTHQARLQAWIPFFRYLLPEEQYRHHLSPKISPEFSTEVAHQLYINNQIAFSVFDSIAQSPLRIDYKYKYSDLGFYWLYKIVENVTNQPFDQFLTQNFYHPLGLSHTLFRPLHRFPKVQIAPTENDQTFRKQLIHGYVHDPGAAMLGGVCGHAGLFSNAYDLAVIMQMLLQEGTYGGQAFLQAQTVKEFTRRQFPLNENRRGIGFDKPMIDPSEEGPTCSLASPASYGHSGFTGTYVWADPAHQIIYIFLSNRIYPDASNSKLIKYNIRTNIQEVIYKALTTKSLSDSL